MLIELYVDGELVFEQDCDVEFDEDGNAWWFDDEDEVWYYYDEDEGDWIEWYDDEECDWCDDEC